MSCFIPCLPAFNKGEKEVDKSAGIGYNGGRKRERPSLSRIRNHFEQEGTCMRYVCNVCGWVYDEEEKGVKWEDLPEDFVCELCGVGKDDFSPEE